MNTRNRAMNRQTAMAGIINGRVPSHYNTVIIRAWRLL